MKSDAIVKALMPSAEQIERVLKTYDELLKTAKAKLVAGESCRVEYDDDNVQMIERVVHALEDLGARVTCEDPWGEPPWVELRLL
jgi:hypothetical protein